MKLKLKIAHIGYTQCYMEWVVTKMESDQNCLIPYNRKFSWVFIFVVFMGKWATSKIKNLENIWKISLNSMTNIRRNRRNELTH